MLLWPGKCSLSASVCVSVTWCCFEFGTLGDDDSRSVLASLLGTALGSLSCRDPCRALSGVSSILVHTQCSVCHRDTAQVHRSLSRTMQKHMHGKFLSVQSKGEGKITESLMLNFL